MAIKRAYEVAKKNDGFRVLVDRLWPRGVSKEKAKLDVWLKEIAPTTELRKWFGHKPDHFDEFETRYRKELNTNSEVDKMKQIIKDNPKVTLVYSAHDEEMNQAVVLKRYLEKTKA